MSDYTDATTEELIIAINNGIAVEQCASEIMRRVAHAEKAAEEYRLEQQLLEDMARLWRPIETAPKDGNHILLFRPHNRFVGYYGGAESGWRINAPGLPSMWPEPTHWQPLPEGPTP